LRLLDLAQDRRDIDRAVRGCEGAEAARGLLELALEAGSVPAAGLVPGDDDVDEPLEEVLLRGLGRAPGVLERLVRGEVLARPGEVEAALEVALHPGCDASKCYPRAAVATILLAAVDLFIRGKLEASLPDHHFVTSDSADPPDLVIADVARVDPYDVADSYPDVPLLGFTNHKDTAGLRRANEAGFDQVVAKSALDERAPELIDGLIASLD
jgi:hypothetical protein